MATYEVDNPNCYGCGKKLNGSEPFFVHISGQFADVVCTTCHADEEE